MEMDRELSRYSVSNSCLDRMMVGPVMVIRAEEPLYHVPGKFKNLKMFSKIFQDFLVIFLVECGAET